MKPQRFKPGQEVVCIDGEWIPVKPGINRTIYPKFNEICMIDHYCGLVCKIPGESYGEPFVHLVGFAACYSQDAFAPVISDTILEKELNSIPETVTA